MSLAIATAWPAASAWGAAMLMLWIDRRNPKSFSWLAPIATLAILALAVAEAGRAQMAWPALAIALVVATLSRHREDLLHSECAVKLLWVMGASLALSSAGVGLLVLATGTSALAEQWAVLQLGLDPRFLWGTALSLSLLVGLVMLGAAPFHFWAADLFQGVRPWLAPLAVVALQVAGAGWLSARLAGIEAFPAGSALVRQLLGIAALIAFVAGAATLLTQRRPERRVGTFASLNGALLLASLAAAHGSPVLTGAHVRSIPSWAGHLAIALSGAGTFARFVPVSTPSISNAPVLLRRHPWSASLGLYSLFSLAGVPGTPGARVWLGIARDLTAGGRTWLVLALAAAWLSSLTIAARQLREAVGTRSEAPLPTQPVPWQARGALWISGGALIAMELVGWGR